MLKGYPVEYRNKEEYKLHELHDVYRAPVVEIQDEGPQQDYGQQLPAELSDSDQAEVLDAVANEEA